MVQRQRQSGAEVKTHITIEYVRFGVPVVVLQQLKQDTP